MSRSSVSRMAHACEYGPEIAHALAPRTAIDHQPRKLLVEGDGQHRIGLVVAVADVEARIELLDPVVFQLQRLDLGVDHRPLDLGRGGHHLPGPRMQVRDVGEVRRQPATQALGLADVDDSPMRIPESVDARLDRDGPGRGAIRRGIWHVSRLVVARRMPRKAGDRRRWGRTTRETAARYPGWSRRSGYRAGSRSRCRRAVAGPASPKTWPAGDGCGTNISGWLQVVNMPPDEQANAFCADSLIGPVSAA